MQEQNYKFSEVLRSLLNEKKISGAELGRRIGVSKEAISKYCKGENIPKTPQLLKLAAYFDVSPEYLLTGVDPFDKQEHQELGLSGEAIRLLKQCQDELVRKLVNRLLGSPEFYNTAHNVLKRMDIFITEKQIDLTIKSLIKVHRGDEVPVVDDIIAFIFDNVCFSLLSFMFGEALEIFGGFDVIDARVRAVAEELQAAPVSVE